MASIQTTGPMERALLLRRLPLFEGMRTAHLVALARVAEEQSLRAGTVVQAGGKPPRAARVLLDGSVRVERGGQTVARLEAPQALGLLDLLAEQPSATRIVAELPVTLLVIEGAVWWDVLEDDFALVMRLRAALGCVLAEHAAARGEFDLVPGTGSPDAGPVPEDPVDQLRRLHRVPLLRPFGVAVLAALLRGAAETRPVTAGVPLLRAGAPAERLFVLTAGRAECRRPGAVPVSAGPGAVLGANAALSGLPHADDVIATSPLVATGIDVQRLWDLAEDHFHVARALLAQAARRLLQLDATLAGSGPTLAGAAHEEELV